MSPVIATEECPSILETTCSRTPAPSIAVAAEWRSVCGPTPDPSMPDRRTRKKGGSASDQQARDLLGR